MYFQMHEETANTMAIPIYIQGTTVSCDYNIIHVCTSAVLFFLMSSYLTTSTGRPHLSPSITLIMVLHHLLMLSLTNLCHCRFTPADRVYSQ